MNCFAPGINHLSEYLNVHPLILSTLPSFLGFFAAFSLPETKGFNLMN